MKETLVHFLGQEDSLEKRTATHSSILGFPWWQMVKNLPAMQDTWVQSLGQEDPLEKGTPTHSSTLAWRIPWAEEPGGLQSRGSQRVGQDQMTEHAHKEIAPHLPVSDRSLTSAADSLHVVKPPPVMKIGESSLLLWVKSVSKHRRLWCPLPSSYTPQRTPWTHVQHPQYPSLQLAGPSPLLQQSCIKSSFPV